jgi:hypothetical protein
MGHTSLQFIDQVRMKLQGGASGKKAARAIRVGASFDFASDARNAGTREERHALRRFAQLARVVG